MVKVLLMNKMELDVENQRYKKSVFGASSNSLMLTDNND